MDDPKPRVITHMDLDAFYAQVEARRLDIPASAPLAVHQWGSCLAVSYSARPFGVKRGDRADVAKQKCPQLHLIHVATIGKEGEEEGPEDGRDGLDAGDEPPSVENSKASLERYRRASEEVMAIFARHCTHVERASIDEAYFDLTELAERELDNRRCMPGGIELFLEEGTASGTPAIGSAGSEVDAAAAAAAAAAPEDGGTATFTSPPRSLEAPAVFAVSDAKIDLSLESDALLVAAAAVVWRIRRDVLRELGFTCSAGIAHNKVLAKLASSKHKPNRQTIVTAAAVPALMQEMPMRDIRGLGGKLGAAVAASFHVQSASDLAKVPLTQLQQRFGAAEGAWLQRISQGIDDEPVRPNLQPKSINCFKSFRELSDVPAIESWLRLLAGELVPRMAADREAHNRRPKTLTLQHRGPRSNHPSAMQARSRPMLGGGSVPTVDQVVAAAMSLLTGAIEHPLPCTRIALSAVDFVPLPPPSAAITSFFAAPAGSNKISNAREQDKVSRAGGSSSSASESCAADVSLAVGKPLVSNSSSSSSSSRSGSSEENSERTAPAEVSGGATGFAAVKCAKCGVQVAPDAVEEHKDYHLAQAMQARYQEEVETAQAFAANRDRQGGRSGRNKRQGGDRNDGGGKKGRAIDSFFARKASI